MKSIAAIGNIKGKRVLVRVDYNVPLKGKKIVDTRRIESSYKTIDTILKKGGTPILVAHLGEGKESLKPVATFLSKRYKLLFLEGSLGGSSREWVVKHATKGTVILLENIRRYPGEEKNDTKFAKLLSSLADLYVNDAFSVSHRAHASLVGVPKYLKSFAGYQFETEIKTLSPVLKGEHHPFLFILGGAKFETKIPLLERFSKISDEVVIAGAILNNFYNVAGFEVGKSVIERGYDETIKKFLKNPKLLLPTDVVVIRKGRPITISMDDVEKGDKIADIGPTSIARIVKKIKKAKLVLWNGPTGWYEAGYSKGTVELAKALIHSKVKGVIGGGDTEAIIEKLLLKLPTKRSHIFVSTGGGAMLDYLAKGTLPAVEALNLQK